MTKETHHRNYTRFQNALAELQNAKQDLSMIEAEPTIDSGIKDAIGELKKGIDVLWHGVADQMGTLLTDFKPR